MTTWSVEEKNSFFRVSSDEDFNQEQRNRESQDDGSEAGAARGTVACCHEQTGESDITDSADEAPPKRQCLERGSPLNSLLLGSEDNDSSDGVIDEHVFDDPPSYATSSNSNSGGRKKSNCSTIILSEGAINFLESKNSEAVLRGDSEEAASSFAVQEAAEAMIVQWRQKHPDVEITGAMTDNLRKKIKPIVGTYLRYFYPSDNTKKKNVQKKDAKMLMQKKDIITGAALNKVLQLKIILLEEEKSFLEGKKLEALSRGDSKEAACSFAVQEAAEAMIIQWLQERSDVKITYEDKNDLRSTMQPRIGAYLKYLYPSDSGEVRARKKELITGAALQQGLKLRRVSVVEEFLSAEEKSFLESKKAEVLPLKNSEESACVFVAQKAAELFLIKRLEEEGSPIVTPELHAELRKEVISKINVYLQYLDSNKEKGKQKKNISPIVTAALNAIIQKS